MGLNEFSIVLSLALTVVFLAYDRDLLSTWWRTYAVATRKIGYFKFWIAVKNREIWTQEEWLCVGIWSGFFFNALDNIYWGITWLVYHLHQPASDGLLEAGPLANIFFRQIGGIWAVYCHIVAAKIIKKDDKETNDRAYWFSGVMVFSLLAMKPLMFN